jgi:NAD(P)-dependent dehydrogenase (short-subunit alcohol dehydrogenase family)
LADRLGGRKVLVTGAAAGIGRACVELFLAEGASVAMLDRDRAGLERANAELAAPARLTSIALDIADREAVSAGVSRAASALGGLDGLVNSAGIDLHQPFEETDWAAWDEIMTVNLIGAMLVCHAALEPMKASGKAAIVNIASGAGLRPIADRVAYCASKAGLVMATKALALDLARYGIRANAVCPGAVDTELFRQSLGGGATIEEVRQRYAMKRIGSVSEVAAAVLFLLSDESSFVTGAALAVDGGRVFH